jgi:hypothetical protein
MFPDVSNKIASQIETEVLSISVDPAVMQFCKRARFHRHLVALTDHAARRDRKGAIPVQRSNVT